MTSKTKLIIQIPCFNEEDTLAITLMCLPKKIEGIDIIETLVIDDGSTDNTLKIAKDEQVNHIRSFKINKGLSKAFAAGIETALEEGADIIVNTDADNQYKGTDIIRLVKPILEGKADVVIGNRDTDNIPHFSFLKKKIQKYGSRLIGSLTQTEVKDSVSGFRAFSREVAIGLNVLSDFSYTLENLIQLGIQKEKVISIPIRTNKKTRDSRLTSSSFRFMASQLATLLRTYSTYKGLKIFSILGVILVLPGMFGFLRFLYFQWKGEGAYHIQSIILSTALLVIGALLFIFGILADLIGNNRKLIEKALFKIKKLELGHKKTDD